MLAAVSKAGLLDAWADDPQEVVQTMPWHLLVGVIVKGASRGTKTRAPVSKQLSAALANVSPVWKINPWALLAIPELAL